MAAQVATNNAHASVTFIASFPETKCGESGFHRAMSKDVYATYNILAWSNKSLHFLVNGSSSCRRPGAVQGIAGRNEATGEVPMNAGCWFACTTR